jgi:phage shock protein A
VLQCSMAITIETVRAVRSAGKASWAAFNKALETATDTVADELSCPANDCEDCYEVAVEALLDNNLPLAREALLDAMSLEGHWTRYDTARAALAAVEAAARG